MGLLILGLLIFMLGLFNALMVLLSLLLRMLLGRWDVLAFVKVVIILIPSCLERVHHLRVIDPIFLVIIFITTIIITTYIITTRIFGKHLIMPFELSNIFLPTGFNGRYFFLILMLILIVLFLRKVLFLIHHVMIIRIINVLMSDLKVIILVIILML